MKQIDLEKFFKRGQITYLQGASLRRSLSELNIETHNSARKQHKSLKWLLDFEGDFAPMPLVMIMFSPWYKMVVLQGHEALNVINIFRMLDVDSPPKDKWIPISKDAIRMVLGEEPSRKEYKELGFWDKGSATKKFKDRLHLVKETTYFRIM